MTSMEMTGVLMLAAPLVTMTFIVPVMLYGIKDGIRVFFSILAIVLWLMFSAYLIVYNKLPWN